MDAKCTNIFCFIFFNFVFFWYFFLRSLRNFRALCVQKSPLSVLKSFQSQRRHAVSTFHNAVAHTGCFA